MMSDLDPEVKRIGQIANALVTAGEARERELFEAIVDELTEQESKDLIEYFAGAVALALRGTAQLRGVPMTTLLQEIGRRLA